MPIRLCLCLVFALLSATAMARDVKMSSPAGGSGSCSTETDAPEKGAKPLRPVLPALPAREAKPRPSLHSDSPRLMPRWHSFLPGMFR